MSNMIYGSINLSVVPKELFKKVKCKDGQERVFLNIKVCRKSTPDQFGNTHFISCEPKEKNDRKEGVNYFCGDMKEYVQQSNTPSQEEIDAAQPANNDDLPF